MLIWEGNIYIDSEELGEVEVYAEVEESTYEVGHVSHSVYIASAKDFNESDVQLSQDEIEEVETIALALAVNLDDMYDENEDD